MLEPAATVKIFQKQADPKIVEAGTAIFQAGQPANYMYGILDGEVELQVEGKTVEVLSASSVFGIGALLGHANRPYTAIAKTTCKLAFLDQQRFLFAVQETPMFALNVMQTYSDRLDRLAHSL